MELLGTHKISKRKVYKESHWHYCFVDNKYVKIDTLTEAQLAELEPPTDDELNYTTTVESSENTNSSEPFDAPEPYKEEDFIDEKELLTNGEPEPKETCDLDALPTVADEKDCISKEMPKYQSHKIVSALKIKEIILDSDLAKETNRETNGSAMIVPEEEGYAAFKVNGSFIHKHNPQVGGYFVKYEDGYISFSPADAFEKGNTKIG